MPKPKPPTDYWIWLAIIGAVLVMGCFCVLAPHPMEQRAPVSTQRGV